MTVQSTLLVDVGNSSIKWSMLSAEKKLSDMVCKYYADKALSPKFFTDIWRSIQTPKKVLVSCVANDTVWHILQKTCRELWSIDAKRVSSMQTACGVINAYSKYETLGSDRWFAMLGAFSEKTTASLVVDCGTAITVDVINAEGVHLGGYILPGLTMMKTSLTKDTADVSVNLDLSNHSLLPAKTTEGCVDAAILLSAVKFIEAVFNQQDVNNSMHCYLTGGDAGLLAEYLSIKFVIIPALVLKGLAHFVSSDTKED